ncbi:receptor-like protein EIX1 [Cornus florida]|uniref:receptor-like protein EIX1 n=1 Tax=Cornus florida TaxID=4283 RepID=UPI00289938E3|nr:receptor-like protein EIX1 [Cornus florida]
MGTRVRMFLFALVFIELGVGIGLQINRDQSNVSCTKGELKALLKFRESLVDESNRLSSWVGEYCCTWTGVGCSKRRHTVVELDLHNPFSFDLGMFFTDSNVTARDLYNRASLQDPRAARACS